jgi:glycosyltransferase involved in cell wall biosynthesis
MRVLHISPSFFPAGHYGGPISSGYGLCNSLAILPGVELQVLTTNSDGPDTFAVESIPKRLPSGYDVYYCRRWFGADIAPGFFRRLYAMVKWSDLVHLTAVYSPPTIPVLFLCSLFGRPLVWSPRGALQRWEGSTRRAAKTLWDRICNSLCDPRRVVLHVTSEKEKEESRRRIDRAEYVVIPNGIELPETGRRKIPREGREFRLLYLGRLHPIKGIENLLQAIPSVKTPISLQVCGDGESDYRESLERLAHELELAGRVRFHGRVSGDIKEGHFREADVCIVPSYKENFCMVIAESLSRGVPVIASRGTPWNLMEDNGCGLWVNNDPESLANAINRIRQMPLDEMGSMGQEWMARDFAWSAVAEKMFKLYENLCKARS